MMKKVLAGITIAAVSLFAAGTTSATVPVTINYTGGCKINNLASSYDLGTIPAILNSSGEVMNPVSFNVLCTDGLNYTVKVNSNTYHFTVGNSDYGMELYADSSLTTKVGYTGVIRTGTGATENISLYPKVYANSGCNYLSSVGKYACESGPLTTTIDITLTW